jgi:hypothetical protein
MIPTFVAGNCSLPRIELDDRRNLHTPPKSHRFLRMGKRLSKSNARFWGIKIFSAALQVYYASVGPTPQSRTPQSNRCNRSLNFFCTAKLDANEPHKICGEIERNAFARIFGLFPCQRDSAFQQATEPVVHCRGAEKSHALRSARALSSRIVSSCSMNSRVVSILPGSARFLDRPHNMLATQSTWAEANHQQVQC